MTGVRGVHGVRSFRCGPQSVCGVCWLMWIQYTGVATLNNYHLEGNFSCLSTGVNSISLNMSFIGC